MQENEKKAFDFASDLTKQLITLSTAIITLTVTFSKDILGGIEGGYRYLLITIWGLYFLSILFGLLTLMALTGNLDPMPSQVKDANGNLVTQKPPATLTITSSNITSTARLQVASFLLALAFTCWYGYQQIALKNVNTENEKAKNSYMIIRKSYLGNDTTVHTDTLYLSK